MRRLGCIGLVLLLEIGCGSGMPGNSAGDRGGAGGNAGAGGASPGGGDGAAELRGKLAAAATDFSALSGGILQSLFPNGFSGDSARYLVADKLCESMAKRVEQMFTIPHFINVVASSSSPNTCDFPDLNPACRPNASCDGAKMTVVFADCTGPFGLVGIMGTLVASFGITGTGSPYSATAQVTTTDFRIGSVSFDLNTMVSAPIDVQPMGADGMPASLDTRSMDLTIKEKGMLTVRVSDGTVFSGQSDIAMTADMATHCITINGSIMANVLGTDYPIDIDNVQQCAGQCSSQGSTSVSKTDPSNAVKLSFDGTHMPKWMSKSGMMGGSSMSCHDKGGGSGSNPLAGAMLYGTSWACTGSNGKLSFMAPTRPGDGIRATFEATDYMTSCTGALKNELGTIEVSQCPMHHNGATGIMEVATSGCVPDYYDMEGGFPVYDMSGYWGGLPLFCEPCGTGACRPL